MNACKFVVFAGVCVALRAVLSVWLIAGTRPEFCEHVSFAQIDSLYWLASGFGLCALWLVFIGSRACAVYRRWARRKRVVWSLLTALTLGAFVGAFFGVQQGISETVLAARLKPREAEIRRVLNEDFLRALNERPDPYEGLGTVEKPDPTMFDGLIPERGQ